MALSHLLDTSVLSQPINARGFADIPGLVVEEMKRRMPATWTSWLSSTGPWGSLTSSWKEKLPVIGDR